MTGAGVVIPVRAFALGMARLAAQLDDETRTELARKLADRVGAAAGELPAVVVSSASDVRDWARSRGVDVIDDPGTLDDAAAVGREWVGARGCARAVIAHADLPLARSLAPLGRDGSRPIVAVVPCHRDDGTTVLAVPVDVPFRFAYGPGSFRRHAAESRRLGLGFRVIRDTELAFDVDVPDDLHQLGLLPDPHSLAR
jgi:2-phospho-L-lactate/phosphoenolpyruvate guanylyltransferase